MMNGYDTRNENLISQDKSLFSQYSPEEQDRIRDWRIRRASKVT